MQLKKNGNSTILLSVSAKRCNFLCSIIQLSVLIQWLAVVVEYRDIFKKECVRLGGEEARTELRLIVPW